jgi:D-inositol-3-phosphate glycosyltransferase
MAVSLGVSDRVDLRGAVPREHVPALLRSADVVACCPWYEPFGLVAVEAMACGVPVVASDVGGLGENVVDGVTGLLVPPRQPRRIAEALAAILGDHDRRRAMGAAGRRRAEEFGWERIAEQTLDVATELVRRHGRTRSTSAEWSA